MNKTESPSADSDNDTPRKQPSTAMTIILFAGLACWIASIAVGTILYREQADADLPWLKALLVVLPMALFLSLWGALLWQRKKTASRN